MLIKEGGKKLKKIKNWKENFDGKKLQIGDGGV